VPLFGGFRGGRKRADGLTPGSKEAVEADRKKDRERKKREYDARKAALEPPALPSVKAALADSPAPPAAGVSAESGPPAPAPLPWQAETLKPLFEQLLPTVEDLTARQITSRAEKAKLPPDLLKEIARDARWPSPAKKAVDIAAPQVAAKWLNRAGLSAEYQPELVLFTAVAAIGANQQAVLHRLDKLIALREAAEKAKDKK
jgi:hypothetical protein